MKFKEIKSFTSFGSYNADIPLDYVIETIGRYLTNYNLELNPDFQRGHVWTDDQRMRYVEFLLKEGQSSRTIYFNCPGWMDDFHGPFVLVDGKQRLDAIMKFIRNEIPAFGHKISEYTDRMPVGQTLKFNINNLKTRKEVLQWYLDLNAGGVVHTSDEINKVKSLLAKEK